MNNAKFLDIQKRVANGDKVFIEIGSGKYKDSILQALDTKTHTTYKGTNYGYKTGTGYGVPGGQYEDHKIKFKVNGKTLWLCKWYLYEADWTTTPKIVIKAKTLKGQNKKPPKDFLGREFTIEDVVFLYSTTYGEMLGVVDEINDKGTLTLRVAKRQHSDWMTDRAKQGIFKVPYERAHRVMIIDDPAILLLRA